MTSAAGEPVAAGGRTARASTVAATALAVLLVLTVAVPSSSAAVGARGEAGERRPGAGDDDGHALLTRSRDATAAPHSGQVTVVSFTSSGPRVAELAVRVDGDLVELRRPARILVDPLGGVVADEGAVGQRAPTSPLGFDVDAIVARWAVTVGRPVELDTGRATPVHLVRTSGTAISETLYVDDETGIAVRRETRHADGSVLRVVAYTWLDAPGRGPLVSSADRADAADGGGRDGHAGPTGPAAAVASARAAGFDVPPALDEGFLLVTVESSADMAVARYTDGLSVVSIYQQHGELDAASLEGAVVQHVADRDVWTWPGREPSRFVWTGDGLTWTAVSDAPAPIVEGSLSSLPGDLVGHDATHRIRHGLRRVWELVTAPVR